MSILLSVCTHIEHSLAASVADIEHTGSPIGRRGCVGATVARLYRLSTARPFRQNPKTAATDPGRLVLLTGQRQLVGGTLAADDLLEREGRVRGHREGMGVTARGESERDGVGRLAVTADEA